MLCVLFLIFGVKGLFELGIVPYYVAQEQYGVDVIQKVQDVMREIESQSCLKFVQLVDQNVAQQTPRALLITNEGGVRECDHIPKTSQSQVTLTLGYDCLGRGQILHTILHGIGMKDEVTNPGRDQYVRIMWANIAPEYRPLYQLASDYQPKNIEYDPRSVMQFHDRAYSVNGKPSLEPLISGLTIEQSENLSQLDILRLHLLYNSECTKRDVQDLLQTCKNTLQSAPNSPDTDFLNGQKDANEGSSYDDIYADRNPNVGINHVNVDKDYVYQEGNTGDAFGNPSQNVDGDYTQADPNYVGDDYTQRGNTGDATFGGPSQNVDGDYTQADPNYVGDDYTQGGNTGDATFGGPSQNVDEDYTQGGNTNYIGKDYTQGGNIGYAGVGDMDTDVVVDDLTPDNPATYTSNEANS